MTTALQLGDVVADGRLATVYRGSLGGRAVAVKRARADVRGAAAALRREARVLLAASHPGIVPVLDVVEDLVVPALVLGWADGGSLGDLLADGPLSATELIHVLRPVAGGLGAMHLAGVAHLDVTIHNVLLAAAGPVLIDPAPPGSGTPGFADPVLIAGGPASARSDVFGLAACAHVGLTGRLPRVGGGLAVGPSLPLAVAEVLAVGLHPDPHRRPSSPSAWVDLLETALAGIPRRSGGSTESSSTPAEVSVEPARHASCPAARTPVPARTWPFDRWQEEADAGLARRTALPVSVREAGPPPRRRERRAVLVVALLAVCAVATALAVRSAAARSAPSRPVPRRLTAPDIPQQPVRRPPQPLEANHDTPTSDRALACCPWPRTRAGG